MSVNISTQSQYSLQPGLTLSVNISIQSQYSLQPGHTLSVNISTQSQYSLQPGLTLSVNIHTQSQYWLQPGLTLSVNIHTQSQYSLQPGLTLLLNNKCHWEHVWRYTTKHEHDRTYHYFHFDWVWICSVYFILFLNVCFYMLLHDYNLCFNGSPCYNVSYYNFNSGWPYYIVIDFLNKHNYGADKSMMVFIQAKLCAVGAHYIYFNQLYSQISSYSMNIH